MTMVMSVINSDVLIIGSGVAGLRAALEVSRRGKQSLLISKSPVGKANNTSLALGTFRCATESFGIDIHVQKTLESGKMLNDRSLVETFVKQAPSMVKELLELGMEGTMLSNGISSRVSSPIGGSELTSTLRRACQEAGVQVMEGIMVTDLIVDEGACCGAIGFQKRTGDIYGFRSGSVILATGGAGAIYSQNDNAPGTTGDGYVLALEADLELIDMEFVQFFPLLYAGSGSTKMILPPQFADLGKLTNRLGEDLKVKYNLHERPLAIVSRDRFAQALFREISQGNGIDGAVLLDMQGLDDALIPLSDQLKEFFKGKISYDSRPIKIKPACHHTMGGIRIDCSGCTDLKGLFAAGEVVGGIHGANRMGGNALTESLVLGALAARSAAEYAISNPASADFDALSKIAAQKRFHMMDAKGSKPSKAKSLMKELGQVLWEKAGIVRQEKSLREGIERIDGILSKLDQQSISNPREFCKIMELRNAALTGRSICISALKRKESRGAHYRDDFPEEDERWLKHIHVKMSDEGPQISRIIPVKDMK